MSFRRIVTLAGLLAAGAALGACTQAQVTTALATPTGQLFCAVETASGPQIVALTSSLGTGAVLATGVAQGVVTADCAASTASIPGATGPATPISPPAASAAVTQVAITPAS